MKKLYIIFYLLIFYFPSCNEKNAPSEREAAIIENQIRVRVEKYIESVKALDSPNEFKPVLSSKKYL